MSGLSDVVDVHGGREHVAALTSSGQVYTWGSNQKGRSGSATPATGPGRQPVPGMSDATAVESGHNHTLVLRSDGTVWTFGLNASGQLGDGTTTLRRAPVQVKNLTGVVAIAAGRDMSYAIKSDGTAWAWGANSYGELGDGTTTNRSTPVQVKNPTNVVGIAGGRDHGLGADAGRHGLRVRLERLRPARRRHDHQPLDPGAGHHGGDAGHRGCPPLLRAAHRRQVSRGAATTERSSATAP